MVVPKIVQEQPRGDVHYSDHPINPRARLTDSPIIMLGKRNMNNIGLKTVPQEKNIYRWGLVSFHTL